MGRLNKQRRKDARALGKNVRSKASDPRPARRDLAPPTVTKLGSAVAGRSIVGRELNRLSNADLATRMLVGSAMHAISAPAAVSSELADHEAAAHAALGNANTIGATEMRTFAAELREIIDRADVVVEVLDARDPEACRCLEVEEMVLHKGRKLVLLLNKCDLVPPEAAVSWQEHLSQFHPTICFKSATAESGRHGAQITHRSHATASDAHAVGRHVAVGATDLLDLVRKYAHVGGGAGGVITVGFVGIPNSGKSSVINSVCRAKVASAAPNAGHTRALQEVRIDKTLTVIDSPGVVMGRGMSTAQQILLSVVPSGHIDDMTSAVAQIIARVPCSVLCRVFNIAPFPADNPRIFLLYVAQAKHMFRQGGIADLENAAKIVVQAWQRGDIPAYVPAPTQLVPDSGIAPVTGAGTGAEFVQSLGQAFVA